MLTIIEASASKQIQPLSRQITQFIALQKTIQTSQKNFIPKKSDFLS